MKSVNKMQILGIKCMFKNVSNLAMPEAVPAADLPYLAGQPPWGRWTPGARRAEHRSEPQATHSGAGGAGLWVSCAGGAGKP